MHLLSSGERTTLSITISYFENFKIGNRAVKFCHSDDLVRVRISTIRLIRGNTGRVIKGKITTKKIRKIQIFLEKRG
jgi:hypothetical protein